MSSSVFVFAILVIVLTASCSATSPGLAGTEWVLEDSKIITLRFDARTAGGYAGCNWYGGGYEVEGDRLRFEEFSSTLRGCTAEGVEDGERRYLAAIGGVRAYDVTEDRLTLKGAGGEALLVFRRRVPLDMNPADLIGTRWRLRSNPAVTIAFSESTISGFAGCRGYTGTYQAKGDSLNVSSITMSDTECRAPDAVLIAEGDFTTDLSETTHYRLTPKTLELFSVGGTAVTFDIESR